MKYLVTLILLIVSLSIGAQSQESMTDFPTGYMTTSYYSGGNTIKSIDGVLYMIYDDVPVILLRYPPMNEREEFEVPSTVRRIANNAFQGTRYLKTLKFHDTVSYGKFVQLNIGESAFNDSSIENFVVIENDGDSSQTEVKDASTSRKAVKNQYDINGRPVAGHASGVNIVQYDDDSSEKVLRK